jgi:hypothetical protein
MPLLHLLHLLTMLLCRLKKITQKIGVLWGWHKVDNACPLKVPTLATSLQDSKTVMQFYRNRAVPSGVLRSKRYLSNKMERMAASREKRKISCIPTPKVTNFVLDQKLNLPTKCLFVLHFCIFPDKLLIFAQIMGETRKVSSHPQLASYQFNISLMK